MELPKTYNPKEVEDKIPHQFCKYFLGEALSTGKAYSAPRLAKNLNRVI